MLPVCHFDALVQAHVDALHREADQARQARQARLARRRRRAGAPRGGAEPLPRTLTTGHEAGSA